METYRNSQFMAGIESWKDGCLSVPTLKDGGTFGTIDVVKSDSFGHLNLVEGILFSRAYTI